MEYDVPCARMRRIGLTGGIAAGKSTVAARMAEDGAHVIDYDALAHLLHEPGSPAIAPLTRRFGGGILDARGAVDRAALGRRVFGGADRSGALRDLNAIMHPLVYELARRDERRILDGDDGAHVIVHDVPLLSEVLDTIPFAFDHVVDVHAGQGIRIDRLMRTRGMTHAQAVERVQAQGSDRSRAAISDTFVDSSVPLEQMFESVDRLVAAWFEEME